MTAQTAMIGAFMSICRPMATIIWIWVISLVVLVMRLGTEKDVHFLAARVHHMMEQIGADGKAEAGGRLRGKVAAADSQYGTGQRTQEHLAADGQHIGCVAAGGLDERGEPRHIIGQLQVESRPAPQRAARR